MRRPSDAEQAVATVRAALAADGPLVRSQVRERLAGAGVRTEGQVLVHILALASIRGLIVRGPAAGGSGRSCRPGTGWARRRRR